MRRQEGRSVARRNAEWSPRLSGLRSLSIVRSQDWRGRPLGRRQSTERRSVDARSAREWSSAAAARAICPNSLRRHCCISEETGGWSVCGRTHTLVTCAIHVSLRKYSAAKQQQQLKCMLAVQDDSNIEWKVKLKVKVRTLDNYSAYESPPQKRSGMARVHKGFHSFTCAPTRSSAIGMSHPIYTWYSFTDTGRLEGWVDFGAK